MKSFFLGFLGICGNQKTSLFLFSSKLPTMEKEITTNSVDGSRPSLVQLIGKGLRDDEIQKVLFDQYQDDYHVMNLMKEVKRLRGSRKTSSGLILILIGAAMLLMSCVLTLTGSYSAGSFGMVLFGLTTIGITIAFFGFVRIFS